MPDEKEKLPLDARILSEAIIELNISRRMVSIYPRGHPSVENSLNRAFGHLQKLFELRPEITLAVAKDTLIIDDYFLDKKNPVYNEFALRMSRMNIAYVTFIGGLTKDELYEFHSILSADVRDSSSEALQQALKGKNMIHIRIGFIDYDAFSFQEGKAEKEAQEGHLWERYVYGLLKGTLQTVDLPDALQEIPPEMLAGFLNQAITDDVKEESYDRVITTYMRRSSERAFSSKDIKRLMDFINGLRPELKRQFLSSAFKAMPKDIDAAEKALKDVSADEIIELLTTVNEQKINIPEPLKNLLDKFSQLHPEGTGDLFWGGGLIADDIFLSPDVTNLLREGNFEKFVTDTYQKEIQKLSGFAAAGVAVEELKELKKECSDEYIERDFSYTVLELMLSDIISEDEYSYFVNILKEQAVSFMGVGQYGMIVKITKVLEANAGRQRFSDRTTEAYNYFNSEEFISQFVDSLRITGRQMREEALLLCDYYGERIITLLMDALAEEDSDAVRRFLIDLIIHFGDKAVPEAINRLGDSRWFVKRNMLFVLRECGGKEVLPYVRLYHHHDNLKVSFEAIKCLLNAGDSSGIAILREYLMSDSAEAVEQAIALSGALRIRELVPDLIQMLKKRSISGVGLYDKISIVNALGQIGDPIALSALREMLSSKSLLFKGTVEKLKEEIYMTLRNYPHENIKDLIEAGAKSRNEQIKKESLRLRREYAE